MHPVILNAPLMLFCLYFLQLLSLIVARPLIELRHYFDLIKHLLRVKDELQSLRVLAVLCGLRGPVWRLRPNFQSGRMENESIFGDIADESADGSERFGADTADSSRYPPPPDFAHPGILCGSLAPMSINDFPDLLFQSLLKKHPTWISIWGEIRWVRFKKLRANGQLWSKFLLRLWCYHNPSFSNGLLFDGHCLA